MTITHKPFAFDTVFDDEGGVASQPVRVKRTYTPEEVEMERAKAFSDGERGYRRLRARGDARPGRGRP